MADTSQGPGWWQASDGRWYPPEMRPGWPPPPFTPQEDPTHQPLITLPPTRWLPVLVLIIGFGIVGAVAWPSAGFGIGWAVAMLSTVWVGFDHRAVKRTYGFDRVGYHTSLWVMFMVFLLILALPIYLFERHRQRSVIGARSEVPWVPWLAAALVFAVGIGVVVGVKGASPGGLPDGISLTQFEAHILRQVQTTGEDGFGVTDASSASCVLPASWTPGSTFECFIYNSGNRGLGVVQGTVLPSRGNRIKWNSDWLPTAGAPVH